MCNKATERKIIAMQKTEPNTIAIFGGAIWVTDIDELLEFLPAVVRNAKIYKWEKGLANACRTFCHLCFIDPMLVEAYIGMKFEQLLKTEV